jgi:hypothetical protein
MSAVCKLEQKKAEPSWATVQTLAKNLGVKFLDVVAEGGESSERKPPPKGRPRNAPSAVQAGVARPGAGHGTVGRETPRRFILPWWMVAVSSSTQPNRRSGEPPLSSDRE